ncbi:MAG: phospholipase [Phenylobacterium sp. RIFCSPHIGHO2_01_FULL_69_31]|uniref:patatin-like phospholipase family protein n=1 Tax=Phenylobacterium sp. RIFCSPHIGHO2_01_FULL_69_31 TaxID=1801944 RepID=UPI0008C28AA0|nr:patatin-like phospholipase family protein [Phenylobacterium sp. RIFCSPHIGHO2_01_FULL_69_31]OHB29081.1 MAG: phospholipase [Phenylobacterium sp. RIFCSPHIGHO2_01_FULL_69_31]
MRRLFRALALSALLLGGCQTLPRVPYGLEMLHAASPSYRYDFLEPDTRARFVHEFGRVQREQAGDIQLLALSGGGANGAYGAGVIYGWSQRGDRPAFSVVTGVSAGALIAPFVFAGPAFDPALREAFTDGRSKNLLRSRGLGALFRPGVFKPEPLRKLITDSVTPALIEAVAKEHRKGRRLFVATTSLDTQTQVVWDMGALAQHRDPASRLLFQNILIASSSVPGVFPPVLLTVERDGHAVSELHADGGTVANFFVAPQALLAAPTPSTGAAHIFILLNSRTTPRFVVVPVGGLKIVARSFDTMLKSLTVSEITNVKLAASEKGLKLAVGEIPDELDENFLDFTQAHMNALFSAGQQRGAAGTAFRLIAGTTAATPP